MAKLSKDSSSCSLCPRWLDISSAGSPQRTQSYTENGYWSNQQPESSVSDACLETPRSLFSKPIRTASQCCESHLGSKEVSMLRHETGEKRTLPKEVGRTGLYGKGSV